MRAETVEGVSGFCKGVGERIDNKLACHLSFSVTAHAVSNQKEHTVLAFSRVGGIFVVFSFESDIRGRIHLALEHIFFIVHISPSVDRRQHRCHCRILCGWSTLLS